MLTEKIDGHSECMKEHLDKGDYTNLVHHLAVLIMSCLAAGEECSIVLLSNTEMDHLAEWGGDKEGGLVESTMAMLRDFKQTKEREDG